MKTKFAIVILVVVILLLGVALLVTHKNAVEEKQRDTTQIINFSNTLGQTATKLKDQVAVNETLTTNLTQRTEEAAALTSRLAQTSQDLAQTRTTLAKTQSEAKAAAESAATALARTQSELQSTTATAAAAAKKSAEEIAKRDARITELTTSQDDLTKKIGGLNSAITDLNQLIAKTEQELATTKGDKAFLITELKRLQDEKAQLEKQMNDLAYLREQVSKLKSELSIAKRLDWIRRGLYGDSERRGGSILQNGFPTAKSALPTNAANLNVELKRDGTVTITPVTNAPPAAPTAK
jgi:chromosome segregation ATPase